MISKHFSRQEMRCKCGCEEGEYPESGIVILLELVRDHFGNKYDAPCKIDIKSGNRCKKHNEAVQEQEFPKTHNNRKYIPFSSNSTHTKFIAADFKVYVRISTSKTISKIYRWNQVPPNEIHCFLDELFPNTLGLGLYSNRNHADTRNKKARWYA